MPTPPLPHRRNCRVLWHAGCILSPPPPPLCVCLSLSLPPSLPFSRSSCVACAMCYYILQTVAFSVNMRSYVRVASGSLIDAPSVRSILFLSPRIMLPCTAPFSAHQERCSGHGWYARTPFYQVISVSAATTRFAMWPVYLDSFATRPTQVLVTNLQQRANHTKRYTSNTSARHEPTATCQSYKALLSLSSMLAPVCACVHVRARVCVCVCVCA